MRKAASMFIFLVLGTACIIDLEPETDVVETSISPSHGTGHGAGSADIEVMAVRGQAVRPDEATPGTAPGATISLASDRACPGCNP